MKIRYFSLLAASLILALVFTLSCSSGGGGGSFGSGQYCYVSREGHSACALIGIDPSCWVSSVTECQDKYEGAIQTFAYCSANADETSGCDKEEEGFCLLPSGRCYSGITPSECRDEGGAYNKNSCPGNPPTNPSSSSRGGNNVNNSSSSGGGNSNGQYCLISSLCVLMGNSPSCYIPNATECRAAGGSTQTLTYCNANALGTLGCDQGEEGSCWVLGTCISEVTPSMCELYEGTYSNNSCPTDPDDDIGYCLYSGKCERDMYQSYCNLLNGTFNKNSCPASPTIPSNGQYCYDGDYYCDLIGTASNCWVKSAAECTGDGGTVRTYEWCSANVEIIAGCIYDDYDPLFRPLSKKSSNLFSQPQSKQLDKSLSKPQSKLFGKLQSKPFSKQLKKDKKKKL